MPVVTIRALPGDGTDRTSAPTRIAADVAAAAGIPPTDIWVVWTEIPAGGYVIGDDAPSTQPRATHPPLVDISAAGGKPRSAEQIETILVAASRAVARELAVEETNVRVTYNELVAGRLYSRGRFQ